MIKLKICLSWLFSCFLLEFATEFKSKATNFPSHLPIASDCLLFLINSIVLYANSVAKILSQTVG